MRGLNLEKVISLEWKGGIRTDLAEVMFNEMRPGLKGGRAREAGE